MHLCDIEMCQNNMCMLYAVNLIIIIISVFICRIG